VAEMGERTWYDLLFLPSFAGVACPGYSFAVFILDPWTRHDITWILRSSNSQPYDDACMRSRVTFRVLVGMWVEDSRIWHLVEFGKSEVQ